MSPWLVRQKLVHGVWAVSTNLGEALYAATSPRFHTWTPAVRADADHDGVNHTVGARYHYFVAESLKHIQQDPGFYARQVASSYWQFLNCFNRKVRSQAGIFAFPLLTGLLGAQILFSWITAALLLGAGLRMWQRSGTLAGCVFLLASSVLFAVWSLAPSWSGVIILVIGVATSLLRRHWQHVGLLGWSLALTGIGDALFNNAILYRAVLMTDWIFSLFYLAAFYYSANLITHAILRVLGAPLQVVASEETAAPFVSTLEHWNKLTLKVAVLAFTAFVLAGSVRLLIVNSRSPQHPVVSHLSEKPKRDVIAHLRGMSAVMRRVLPEPQTATLVPIEPAEPPAAQKDLPAGRAASVSSSTASPNQAPVLVESETLSHYVYYFPKGTEFEQRDPLFTKRQFDCSIFRTSQGMAVFPGTIPQWMAGREVVLVGRLDRLPPGRPRPGKVVQCLAIVPMTDEKDRLDYIHALTLKTDSVSVH